MTDKNSKPRCWSGRAENYGSNIANAFGLFSSGDLVIACNQLREKNKLPGDNKAW